jgi:hypothetical protein
MQRFSYAIYFTAVKFGAYGKICLTAFFLLVKEIFSKFDHFAFVKIVNGAQHLRRSRKTSARWREGFEPRVIADSITCQDDYRVLSSPGIF